MADDKLAARYRALATEEPSAVLDDAIRAAARRGVSAGPVRARPSRWAVPASIAAVLLLSVGVTMRMQEEQPGIETSEAPRVAPPKAAIELAMRKDVAPEPAPVAPMKVAPKPVAPPPAEKVAAAPPPAPAMAAPAPTPPPPAQPIQTSPTVAAMAPPPVAQAAPAPSPAPALRAASPAAGAARDASVARSEAFVEKEKRAKTEEAIVVETPERKLEKIIELRRAGRHAEADEAVARFRREHPDYTIPEATWERIKPP